MPSLPGLLGADLLAAAIAVVADTPAPAAVVVAVAVVVAGLPVVLVCY